MLEALLLRFAPYRIVLELALIGGGALVGAYEIHKFLMHERNLGAQEVQTRWDTAKAEAEKAQSEREEQWSQRLQEANAHANEREQTIRTLAAAAGNSDGRLRDTLAAIRASVPQATPETLGHTVTTLSAVLEECTGRYRQLAEKADRHAADVKTLQEAWPVDPPPAKK
jgi:chromosome segregation ATPase